MAAFKRTKTPSSSSAGSRRAYSTRGGIKSGNRQGTFGRTWWGQRWLKVFEPSAVESRLSSGRSFAREGQVLTVDIEPGLITGTVQGNELRPFDVRIEIKKVMEYIWEDAETAIAENSKLAATILSGKLPENIDSIFGSPKVSLFPNRLKDIKSSCTCSDWANPCKHSAAVYYVLSEQIDRDPFILFTLRGRTRSEIQNIINNDADGQIEEQAPAPGEPLPDSPEAFWGKTAHDENPRDSSNLWHLSSDALIVARLGPFPFWRGENPLYEEVKLLYRSASHKAWELLLPEDQMKSDTGRFR